jgi:ABC-type ATPase involved in cell division
MKTLNFEETRDIFAEFALSNEEMIYVRGGSGEGEPTLILFPPTVKI